MGTSALLTLGMRSMFASQAALQTIGQNIANANTPGYSRQQVLLTTPEGQYTGAGFFGKGVNVQTVTRAHNDFLTKEAASAKSQAFMDSTRSAQLMQLEKLFPTGDQGLGQSVNVFLNAMVDVASRPADPSARQVVLGRAQDLAARFQNAGQQLADLQSGVVSDMNADVKVVNQLTKQIAQANDQIARTMGSGHDANDLLDQRDRLVSELSQYVQVTTVKNDRDGSLGVFIGGGQRLVLGSQAQELQVSADPYDGARAQLSIKEASGNRVLDESVLTGGTLTALLSYQNKDLQDARNMLGQMAQAMADRVNRQQSLGMDLNAQPGAPMFKVAQPAALPASTNTGTGSLQVDIKPGNGARVPAKSFVIQADPNGVPDQYLVAVRDGSQPTLMTKSQIEDKYGFTLTAGGSFNPGDSFLVEPAGTGAASFKVALDNPAGIAAAAPVTATVASTNRGTATVDSLYTVNDKYDKTKQPLTIQFGSVDSTDQSINYTITLSDGSTLAGKWKAGSAIGNDPLSGIDLGFELRLNGVPRGETVNPDGSVTPGDKISMTVSDKVVSTNNGNAKAFLGLQKEAFVGRQLQADGSLSRGQTMTEAYAAAMADVGSRVQGAQYLSEVSSSVASDAEATRSGQAGVNLDEEAARLMQFQQSYQAAAKVLQTAQNIFDQLLSIVQR